MKNKTSTGLLIGLVTLVLGTSPAAKAETLTPPPIRSWDVIQEKGEIRVAVYRDFAPFSQSENGVLAGVDIDIAKALGGVLGVTVAFKEQTPADSVDDDLRNAIWRGHYIDHVTADVMLHIPTDPALVELNDKVTIFAPYYREQLAIASDPQSFKATDGIDAFRHAQVGVELATMSDMVLLTKDHGALINNVHHYKTLEKAVEGMDKGEVVAVMGVRAELEGALGTHKTRYAVTGLSLPEYAHTSWSLGMAVDAKNPSLAKALGEAMTKLVADGTIAKIFSEHGMEFVAP